jgi:hypothetical protein
MDIRQKEVFLGLIGKVDSGQFERGVKGHADIHKLTTIYCTSLNS